MKRLTTLMLGLNLALGAAWLSLAAQEKNEEKKVAQTATVQHKKKHRKHAKKQVKPAATPATPSAK